MLEKLIKKNITSVPNFPKKGIIFRDITSLLENGNVFSRIVDNISMYAKKNRITKIIGIDSRGFIFASPVAYKNKIPLVLARKKGKLPGSTFKSRYKLEYGFDELHLHRNSIRKNDKVLVIDDLIATGGTAVACLNLVKKTNNKKVNFLFIVELSDLPGRAIIEKSGHNFISLSRFNEEDQ